MRARINKTLLVLSLLALPLISRAEISKLVFTTDPQTAKPSELSGPLTIQTQDGSGTAFKTPETIDLVFTSTSATGEFLGSTGNVVTKTMSTNTSNRTFYYRDSAVGTFALTVNATGRTSGSKWSVTQNITVSNSTTAQSSPTPELETSAAITSNIVEDSNPSVFYSSVPVTSAEPKVTLQVGAGKDRMGTVGTPLQFKATSNFGNGGGLNFSWNFGDGSIAYGEIQSHAYSYPGEYVVVLSATSLNGKAVSRANVKIVPDTLTVTNVSQDRIEITNSGMSELNLFGRGLAYNGKTFVFPEDTIIKPKQKISFPSSITDIYPPSNIGVALVILSDVKNKAVTLKANSQEIYDQILVLERQQMEIKKNLAASTSAVPADQELIIKTEEPLQVETLQTSKQSWFTTIKHFFGFK